MFYLNEIKLRVNYLLLSFFFTISTLYIYGNLLVFLLFYKVTDKTSDRAQVFTYSNPADLLNLCTTTAFYFSIFLLTYQLSHQVLDFLKPSLFFYEYFFLAKTLYLYLIAFLCFNFFFCFVLFPKIWVSSIVATKASELFSFELTLFEYHANLDLSILQANLCFFMLFFVSFSLMLLELQITFYIYKFYQTFIIILFFFSATSFSLWQYYLLIVLFFFLEFIFFFNILRHKIHKYFKLLSWHCVK